MGHIALCNIASLVVTGTFDLLDVSSLTNLNHGPKPWIYVDFDPFRRRYSSKGRSKQRDRLFAAVVSRPSLNFLCLTDFPHHAWFVSPWKEKESWPFNLVVCVQPDEYGDMEVPLRRLSCCPADNIAWYLSYSDLMTQDYRPVLELWLLKNPKRKPWIIIDKLVSSEVIDWTVTKMVQKARSLGCLVWLEGKEITDLPSPKQKPQLEPRLPQTKPDPEEDSKEFHRKFGAQAKVGG